jgi:hypothetical protein
MARIGVIGFPDSEARLPTKALTRPGYGAWSVPLTSESATLFTRI